MMQLPEMIGCVYTNDDNFTMCFPRMKVQLFGYL